MWFVVVMNYLQNYKFPSLHGELGSLNLSQACVAITWAQECLYSSIIMAKYVCDNNALSMQITVSLHDLIIWFLPLALTPSHPSVQEWLVKSIRLFIRCCKKENLNWTSLSNLVSCIPLVKMACVSYRSLE